MSSKRVRALCLVLPIFSLASCAAKTAEPASKVKKSDLGTLPPEPEGEDLSEDRFQTEAKDDGTSPIYRVKKGGSLKLGKSEDFNLSGTSKCQVASGDIVRVVGKTDKYHLVMLSNPCKMEESGGELGLASDETVKINTVFISEGYYPSKDLEPVSVEEMQAEDSKVQEELQKFKKYQNNLDEKPDTTPITCKVALNLNDKTGNNSLAFFNSNSLITQGKQSGANAIPAASLVYSGPLFRQGAQSGKLEVRGLPSSFTSVTIHLKNYIVNGFAGTSNCAQQQKTAVASKNKTPTSTQLRSNFATTGFNCEDIPDKTLLKSDFTKEGDAYTVAMPKFVPNPNTWMGSRVEVNATVKVKDKDTVCEHYVIQLMSPLVLDFSHDLFPATVGSDAGVKFDLQARGHRESTGWVAGDKGILAIDLNGNGKIDSGRELFGDATRHRTGQLFQNGFEALRELDFNGDGFITADDLLYSHVMVWFDRNQNGVSEADELVSLASLGVTALSLNYQETGWNLGALNNQAPFKAAFYRDGSSKPSGSVYDIYFSNPNMVSAK